MAPHHNVDRLSYLPHPIILNILSFLPYKEAARTSILAKQWQNLWLSTRTVDLDENLFVKTNEISEENQQIQRRVFVDFIRKWIQNYSEPVLNNFRLAFSTPGNYKSDVQNCVNFAIQHKPNVLCLDFSNSEENSPVIELGHGNLESLTLFSCKLSNSCNFKNLGRLKCISLEGMKLSTSSMDSLLFNCPLLESLCLKECWNLESLQIGAPNLRNLVVDNCSGLDYGLGMDTPKLRVFKYSGELIGFRVEYMMNMEEADLDFGSEPEYSRSGDVLYGLLMEIWSVRFLTVCSYMLQVIPTACQPLSLETELDNLQHLILKTALNVKEYYGISFFLNSCPNLEFLTIDLQQSARIFPEYHNLFKLKDHSFLNKRYVVVYKCMTRRLRIVEIKGFKGNYNELVALKYFVKYGGVLEQISINLYKEAGPDGERLESTYREMAEKLLVFRPASPNLQILIK